MPEDFKLIPFLCNGLDDIVFLDQNSTTVYVMHCTWNESDVPDVFWNFDDKRVYESFQDWLSRYS